MFIAFDGIDGAGKTTQIQFLYSKLVKNNYITDLYDMGQEGFMDDIFFDMKKRKIVCDAKIRELLYYFEGVLFGREVVYPLKNIYDRIGIVDRYLLSFYAYGPLNGIPYEQIEKLTLSIPWPDIYFYVDTPPEQAIKRIKKYRDIDVPEIGYRNRLSDSEEKNIDLFLDFQGKVYKNFSNTIADVQKRQNVICLDGNLSIDVLGEMVYKYVIDYLSTNK